MNDQTPSSGLPAITINGRFFELGNDRFIVKGLVYQPDLRIDAAGRGYPDDPLRDDRLDEFKRDLDLFKELEINTLFIYTFGIANAHDKSMKLLEEAGIYVIVLLSEGLMCIHRNAPRKSYTPEFLAHQCKKVDILSQYRNVLGVCAAHNLINKGTTADVALILRRLVHDLKDHMKQRERSFGQRVLPLCVGDDDGISMEPDNFDFLTKVDGSEMTIDFYMLNNYWPAPESENSKWVQAPMKYSHSAMPIVISEYGCNTTTPRTFDEIDTLYSKTFLEVFSGGCVYEYRMGPNRYGIVKISKDGSIEKLLDFDNYRKKLKELKSLA